MILALDVETTGLDPHRNELLGVSVAWREESGVKSLYYEWKDGLPTSVRDMLASDCPKIGHNLRFDMKFLKLNGVEVNGRWEDTKLLAQLLDENQQLGLKPLARKFIGTSATVFEQALKAHLKDLKLKMGDLGDPRVNQELVAEYCCEDTRNTLLLWELFHAQMEDESGINDPAVTYDYKKPCLFNYYEAEMLPLEKVLMDMELQGTRVDLEKLTEAKEVLGIKIHECQTRLDDLTSPEQQHVRTLLLEKAKLKYKTQKKRDSLALPPFNWKSGAHKRLLFYDELGLDKYCHELTESGQRSLKRDVLHNLTLPEGKLKDTISEQIKHQTYTKMLSTYAIGLSDRVYEGRIHGEYHQASREEWSREDVNAGGTVTGRLSHRNPNLGNLPRGTDDYWAGAFVKDIFIPDEGCAFLYADYSQIELRVAAHLAQDTPFLDAFNKEIDPHQQTADALGITRQEGKTVNFLLIYYGSPWRLAIQLGWDPKDQPSLRKAEHIRNGFFNQHPELLSWIQGQRAMLERRGECVSAYGRKRRLPYAKSYPGRKKEHALKQGGNFLVQSVAASICKRAMLSLYSAGFTLVNQVHDSIICQTPIEQAPEKLEEMMHIMTTTEKISVPLEVDGKILTTFKE